MFCSRCRVKEQEGTDGTGEQHEGSQGPLTLKMTHPPRLPPPVILPLTPLVQGVFIFCHFFPTIDPPVVVSTKCAPVLGTAKLTIPLLTPLVNFAERYAV